MHCACSFLLECMPCQQCLLQCRLFIMQGCTPIIFFITLAGALTHHYYLVYAGALSACFCFYYLFKKKIKYLIIYSVSLLSSVGLSIIIFPATINHVFGGRRGNIQKLPLSWQAIMSFNCVSGELTGIRLKVGKSPVLIYLFSALLLLCVVTCPLCFLFRKEKWFNHFVHRVKKQVKKFAVEFKQDLHSLNLYPLFLLLTSAVVWLIVFNSISMITMGEHTDRYLFIIYPSCCLVIVCFCSFILKYFMRKKIIFHIFQFCVCSVFVVLSNIICPCIYLISVDDDVRVNYKDSDIIHLIKMFQEIL